MNPLLRFAARFVPLAVPLSAFAQISIVESNVDSADDLIVALCSVGGFIFAVGLTVSIISIIIAAYYYITAQGEAETIRKAHRMILYGGIAVFVMLIAEGFPSLIASIIAQDIGGGGCN